MATATILQSLNTDADFGGVSTVGTSNRRQVETFFTTLTNGGGAPATITLAKGTWVAFDATKTGADRVLNVATAALQANGNPLVCGVVAQAVSALLNAGASVVVPVNVIVSGYAEDAAVTAATGAGLALVVDATAGRADAIAAGDLAPACGVTLEIAAVGNTCDVWVFKNF